ncbi:PHP domain-containing protein [bacterium]|nr:PHP domain-containing protein [bacterium]MCG2678131.1 PHP domain-containing protein [bacterium]
MLSTKHGKLIFFIIFLFILFLLPTPRLKLLDGVTGLPVEGYKIKIPPVAYILEPFVGTSQYFWRSTNFRFQTLSWLAWIVIFYLLFNLKRRVNLLKELRGLFKVIISFTLICLFITLAPLPKYSLQPESSEEILVDLHSHTTYSHEGIATPEENIRWHLAHGFDVWAITDHPRTLEGARRAKEIAKEKYPQAVIITGQEVKCYTGKQGENFLLLGIDEVVDERKYGREIAKVTHLVHEKYKGAVIVPHWWRKKFHTLEKLANSGVDGFEIYTARVLGPEESIREAIKNVCQKNNLIMIGSSNWHGWGSASHIWTSVHIENWSNLNNKEREEAIVTALRNRKTNLFKVILYDRIEPQNRLRYLFEPFVGMFYYFSSLNSPQLLSWIIWSIIFYFLLYLIRIRPIFLNLAVIGIALLLFSKGVIFLNLWVRYLEYNETLFVLGNILLFSGALLLIMAILPLVHKKLQVTSNK